MEYAKIRNWDIWQTYKKSINQPPWIKLHRRLLRNLEWVSLTDSQKGQLVSIWMLAADSKGKVPRDPVLIQKLCGLDDPPDMQMLMEIGFIEHDAAATSRCRQSDASMSSQIRLDETRLDEIRSKSTASTPPPFVTIMEYLKLRSGRPFKTAPVAKSARRWIESVWDGGNLDDIKAVIDVKCAEWKGDPKTRTWLRPSTLFRPANYEDYLVQAGDKFSEFNESNDAPTTAMAKDTFAKWLEKQNGSYDENGGSEVDPTGSAQPLEIRFNDAGRVHVGVGGLTAGHDLSCPERAGEGKRMAAQAGTDQGQGSSNGEDAGQ